MKRLLLVVMLFVMLWGIAAQAEGIIILGGPEQSAEPVKLNDFKVGNTATLEGYAEVTFVKAEWAHKLQTYNKNMYKSLDSKGWAHSTYVNSGTAAIYLRLYLDILNLHMEPYDFYGDITDVVCTYDEDYRFGGWVRQQRLVTSESYGTVYSVDTLLNEAVGVDVAMLYRGQYSILVTLPNDVYQRAMKEGKSLRVDFKIGENEVTYNLNPKDITVLN